ncbi:MAG: monovalent cation/H+ antiporter subunit D [Rubrivivax sp.]
MTALASLHSTLSAHAIVLPVVLPLVAGALLLLLEARRSRWATAVSLGATALLLMVTLLLLKRADSGAVQAYLVGNWQAPWGIALALDRLAALMLVLTAAVGLVALVYASGRPERFADADASPHFHALFQFQLMGLGGAFLTSDLFNLFVFFEVLLAASCGLMLHGGGRERLRAGLHYVVFNLVGSSLFLIAVALLYGITGTLNMADMAGRMALLQGDAQFLAQAAALLLLLVFAIKAALLPLYFWLPEAYASATAPVAALFAILTKVGVYAVARVATLIFGLDLAAPFLPPLAMATLVLAAVGALAAHDLRGLVAYLVVGSAGTLMLALGLATEGALAAGLFYLVNSILITATWFLIADRLALARGTAGRLVPLPLAYGWAPLGLAFLFAAVAVAGLPPLAGFMGKAMLLQAAGQTAWAASAVACVLGSSLAVMVALARAGSTLFWEPSPVAVTQPLAATERPAPAHTVALLALLAAVAACAVAAGPLATYTGATARQLMERTPYIDAVLGARPVPAALDVRKAMRDRGDLK